MGTEVRCPRGHLWRPDEFDDNPGPEAGPVACPYCGALCTATVPATDTPVPAGPPAGDPDAPPAVPGYQILEVLGRGAMGVVYKARQVRTDRLVALKVPGHLDLETRVRFATEAQAAARVSHPNVVQVYEVGENQGRPFLALEYVDGGTVADHLTGTPLPPRPAAALAETLARAVGAAHAHGVVHRDLKPANILVATDSVARPWGTDTVVTPVVPLLDPAALKVADFGLARRLDTDSGQTRSGMILGTPDYMAPEQAAGDSRTVGPAADVWAVGAILYELLTGRPPFRGTGMLDTLEQLRTLDPVPPRRLQPAVPRDLETVCLKCLHKDPARRYPAAGELADDLRRFLAGEPVRARPVSRLERWVKRARRNPLVAGLTAGLWLVLLAAVAYGAWYHLRLQAQRDRARHHLHTSVRAIEELLTTEVSDDNLALEPRAELKRKELLEKALAFYDELLGVEPDDPDLTWLAARGAVRVGDIHRLLGRYGEAVAAYRGAVDRLAPLAERPPPGTDPAREIGYCHTFIGEVYRLQGDPAEAAAAYRRALAVQEPLHASRKDDPGYLQDLSRSHYNLGLAARRMGRPAEAVAELDEANRLLDLVPTDDEVRRRHRARIALNRGGALLDDGRPREADRECRQAVTLYDALIAESRGRPDFRYERAVAVINLGLARRATDDRNGARAELTGARDVLEPLARDFPRMPQYGADLARAYNGLAALAFDDNKLAEAAALFGRAADVLARLVADHPESADYHGELGIALGNQGFALEGSRPDQARDQLARGVLELLAGLRRNPAAREFREALGEQTRALAELLVKAGEHDRARHLAGEIATALPDRTAAAHRAVALLAGCVAAVGHQWSPWAAAEAGRYEARAVELVTAAGPADWSVLVADPDCGPLLARPGFAPVVGK